MKVKYTKEILQKAVDASDSMCAVIRYFGLKEGTGIHSHFNKICQKFDVDITHFKQKYNSNYTELKPENILVHTRNNRKENTSRLRKALIQSNVEYKCFKCNCGEIWQNEKITLQIHHIDGNVLNNTISNLQFLCPNCHSQTDNFGSKKIKNKCIDCNYPIRRKSKRCSKCHLKFIKK